MSKKSFWTIVLALLAVCLVVLTAGNENVHSQRRPPTPEEDDHDRD